MVWGIEHLDRWMKSRENEHLEFKEARNRFDFEELVRYCVAFANEGGGKIVLGVSDRCPRKVVGTRAFSKIEQTKADLFERLQFRVNVHTLEHPNGRALVFDVPSRPTGMPIQYRGAYLMRSGESLVSMTQDQLRKIFEETMVDFSSDVCHAARFSDLDTDAIQRLRKAWYQKSKNPAVEHLSAHQLLIDLELMVNDQVTYAALILLGRPEALGRHLPQAEIIFEYRTDDASLQSQQRVEYRAGFFLIYDQVWNAINSRNGLYHYQDGLFVWDIPTFNEYVVREAILNAVSHRDYRRIESTFIRQFPRKLEVVSPGGLPDGITKENILWRQSPRNRRLAETLTRCGLVERSGQGVNRMFEESIREGKLPPDFAGSDHYQVAVALRGDVQDPRFLEFLQNLGRETNTSFTTEDFLILDLVHREERAPREYQERVSQLLDLGAIERIGRGRGVRYLLSRRFYTSVGRSGVYTRHRGLDRETNKALLMRHIEVNRTRGSQLGELQEVLPALSRKTIQHLLGELKSEGLIHVIGRTRSARWFPGPDHGGSVIGQ
ncbi:ATP-binding protein [Nitrolancea hollandica]|nr:ATP-binding protein [Nitrolancea hollandica]